MHLTATLTFLVLVGGAEGLWVLLPALLEGRWLGEIWQLPVGGVHGENLVSLALFMECPRARTPTLLGSILGQFLTTVYDVLDNVTVTTSRNSPPPSCFVTLQPRSPLPLGCPLGLDTGWWSDTNQKATGESPNAFCVSYESSDCK